MGTRKQFNPEDWRRTIVFQGETILIRPAEPSDKDFVWKGFQAQDSSFYQYLIPITKKLVDMWYEKIDFSRSIPLDAFVLNDRGVISEFIGNATMGIGSSPLDRHIGGIGMSVFPRYQRRGIGTILLEMIIEIAKILQLRRLELTVVKENIPAIRLYEKLGFEKEGLLRKKLHRDGKDYDMFYMGLILG